MNHWGLAFASTFLTLVVCCTMTVFAGASIETIEIKPTPKDNFATASFSLRTPVNVKTLAYILVLAPGFNGNGLRLLKHKQWLKFAEQTKGAIVACTFKAMAKRKNHFVHYAAAQHGSGAALETALEQLDKKDTQHILKDLPLLIYGHSAGGQFAYGFSCHNPKRMIGFAAAKGGYYFPEPVDGTFKVPGLIVSGQKDSAKRRTNIRKIFELHRAKGAPWCWMEDDAGHGPGNTLSVIIPYFRELLRLQLDSEQKGIPDRSKLSGVTVDIENKKILNEKKTFTAKDTNPKQGWLPSKSVFEAWSKLDTGKLKFAER